MRGQFKAQITQIILAVRMFGDKPQILSTLRSESVLYRIGGTMNANYAKFY